MLTTISLRGWMQSPWAFHGHCRRNAAARSSKWSRQVDDVYRGSCKPKYGAKRSHDETYLENATVIASLLVGQLVSTAQASGLGVGLDSVTVTVESSNPVPLGSAALGPTTPEASCTIKFVSVALYDFPDSQTTFFQSVASILLQLFARMESPPNWEALLSRQDDDNDVERRGSEDFEEAMMKALSVLDDEGEDRFARGKKHQRRAAQTNTFSRMRAAYPSLPTSICRLLSDLIDADSKTRTSYASLRDVVDDLEQMIIEPDVFLHETANGDAAKLDFGARLYGRQGEISQLLNVADKVSSGRESGPLEIVSIAGEMGSGKSFLVRRVGRYLSSAGWIVCEGKFDRMRQSDAFSVVTSALGRFCETIQKMKARGIQSDLEYCWRVSTAIMDSLGPSGIEYLSPLIPGMQQIVGIDSGGKGSDANAQNENNGADSQSTLMQTATDALMTKQRRAYLLCTFVEAISGVGRPILLFYDDIQWGSEASLEFFGMLLKHLADRSDARRNVMFVQAFRGDDDEVGETNPIRTLVSSTEPRDSVNVTNITMGSFSKKELNDILSPVLRLPRRITSPLSVMVHQKTMGNIYFVLEFCKTLASQETKILTFSLAKRRWTWDVDSISVMMVSDSVAGLLVKKLLRIEKDVLSTLMIASCFGSQVNRSVMELLNGLKGIPDIVQNLDAAVEEGLLDKAGPLYMFSHDSIQDAAYKLVPEDEIVQLHVDIGLVLISKGGHAPSDMLDEVFAAAVSHVNMALPSAEDGDAAVTFTPSQVLVFAKLNLKAGQKAVVGKSDFSLAEVHLDAAVSFLPENSWEAHYGLTLQIYDEYSNVLFAQRKLDELEPHVGIILEKAKTVEDKIKAHELTIAALTFKGSTLAAMEHASSVLDSLGFPFPSSIDSETVTGVVTSLSSTTDALTPDQLRAFPLMTEMAPLNAMRIMSAVHMPYSFGRPALFQMMSCQMMQLTLKHGLCVESAEAFANFGYCKNTLFGDFEAGYRLGKLSLVILERLNATNRVSKVYFIIYGFLSLWKEPLQATSEGLKTAVNIGLLEGDYKNALFNQVVLNRQLFVSGCKLAELRDRLVAHLMSGNSSNVPSFNPVLGDLYSVMSLTGESEDEVHSLFGLTRDDNEKQLLNRYAKTGNAPFVQVVYYHRLVKAFWYRDYETTLECCEKYDEYTRTKNLRRVTDNVQALFWGLSALILSRKKNKKDLIDKGQEIMKRMQMWAMMGSKWNWENKALLLEAEYHYALGDIAKAKNAYQQSIRSAHEHRFIHEEALAYELYGICCVEEGDMNRGNGLLEKAKELYWQWGAQKKVDTIFDL